MSSAPTDDGWSDAVPEPHRAAQGSAFPPPADLDAEAAVLSAVMLSRDALDAVRGSLEPRHFYGAANRIVFWAVLDLAAQDKPVDVVTVATILRDRGRLDQIGGTPYLAKLVDATPAVAHVETHAQTVVEKARLREAIATFERAAVELRNGATTIDDARRLVSELEFARPSGPILRSLAERLESLRGLGSKVPTGLEELDKHLRGGFLAQKVMTIGGGPGAGKTTLMVQIARNLARSGVAVGFLAIDEEAAGIDARNLESIGIDRSLAEEPDERTIAEAVESFGSLPFVVFEDCLVEEVFEELARLYPERPRAVMVDSIQTARTRKSEYIDAIRERITDVVQTAKRCARTPGTEAQCYMTSELARGAYRSKQSAEQSEDLASFKESGAVEYQSHVLLVLRTVKGEANMVSVSLPKNRMGTKGTFGLELDYSRATFVSAELPEAAEGESEQIKVATNRAKATADAMTLASVVLRNQGLGETALRGAVRAAGHSWGVTRLGAAKSVLTEGHMGSRLVDKGTKNQTRWFLERIGGGHHD